jgi:hypothetical protein
VTDPVPDDQEVLRLLRAWRELNRENVLASFGSDDPDLAAEQAAYHALVVALDANLAAR